MTGATQRPRPPGVRIATSQGPAHAVVAGAGPPSFLLVLTHGAGGEVAAPDLLATRDAALRLGGLVVLVTQPYRLRGARAPGSPDRQDAAWAEIIAALRDGLSELGRGLDGSGSGLGGPGGALDSPGGGLPLFQGGRSNGARVACRTAAGVGASGVIALAFPLHPPGRPHVSRAAELRVPGRKVLVVNGERDPFGIPGRAPGRRVVVLPGETHTLSHHPERVAAAVRTWLRPLLRG